MIFEILVAVTNEAVVYWDVMPGTPVGGKQRYGVVYFFKRKREQFA